MKKLNIKFDRRKEYSSLAKKLYLFINKNNGVLDDSYKLLVNAFNPNCLNSTKLVHSWVKSIFPPPAESSFKINPKIYEIKITKKNNIYNRLLSLKFLLMYAFIKLKDLKKIIIKS